MKEFFRFFVKAFPFVAGLICTLAALAFLVNFTSYESFSDDSFWLFVVFALIGFPLLLFGINRLSDDRQLG